MRKRQKVRPSESVHYGKWCVNDYNILKPIKNIGVAMNVFVFCNTTTYETVNNQNESEIQH